MTDVFWVAIFATFPSVIAAMLSAWVAIRHYTLEVKVAEIYHATNSMKDALVKSTAAASHSQGMQDQRDIVDKERVADIAAKELRKLAEVAAAKVLDKAEVVKESLEARQEQEKP